MAICLNCGHNEKLGSIFDPEDNGTEATCSKCGKTGTISIQICNDVGE